MGANLTSGQIGRRLRAIRTRHGWSQSRMAKAAGVSQSLLSQVEAGSKQLPLQAIQRLAVELNIEPGEMLGGTTSLEAISAARGGWVAYEQVRKQYYLLRDYIQRSHELLTRHGTTLKAALGGSEDATVLTNLLTAGRMHLQASVPREVDEQPEARALFGSRLPSLDALRECTELVQLFEDLPEQDRKLVLSITKRLAGVIPRSPTDASLQPGVEP